MGKFPSSQVVCYRKVQDAWKSLKSVQKVAFAREDNQDKARNQACDKVQKACVSDLGARCRHNTHLEVEDQVDGRYIELACQQRTTLLVSDEEHYQFSTL